MKRVAIIGGGAGGIMAAIHSSPECQVTVFERQDHPLKKVKASGNGQCNISNSQIQPCRYHGSPPFAAAVIEKYPLSATLDFFLSIGIPVVEGKDGKLYPHSFQASSVVNALIAEAERRGATIETNRRVDSIKRRGNGYELITAGHEKHHFDAVILACGGASYSQLGGARYGYDLAASLGHTIVEPFASIVPLNIPLKKLHRLEGIKWDCRLSVFKNNELLGESVGELLFTKYGISGPVSLDVARYVNDPLCKGAEISIDLFPQEDARSLFDLLDAVLSVPGRRVSFALEGVLKKRMPEVFCEIGGFDHDSVNPPKDFILKFARFCKDIRIVPGESRGLGEAVVAAGGVACDEIDPATMESTIAKNCYLVGELLNVDGDTGGFNLQFAWSSGALAGKALTASS